MAVLSSVVVAGCGGSSASGRASDHPRLATATPAENPRVLTRKASLRYEIRGRAFPLPIVTGSIAGKPTLMLVDTGANSHILAGWFARKHGLPMRKLGDIGTDHVGKPIATYRVDKVNLAIDGWGKLGTTTVLATEVPEVIEKLGIGLFVSPQRLDEEGDSVVLDLAKGEIRSAWWEDVPRDSGVPLVEPEVAKACEENDGPVRGLAFVVPSAIESQPVRLLVDTGAQRSDVFTTSAAGAKLLGQSAVAKEPMYTASGKVSSRRIRNAQVVTGSFTATSDIELIQGSAEGSCPRDGVLAMDVLRSCTLFLGRGKIQGRCASGSGSRSSLAPPEP